MAQTFANALSKFDIAVPAHLVADAEIPVLVGPQAQGDLLIVPMDFTTASLIAVPVEGVQVVVGEATGNSHYLSQGFNSPGVLYARVENTDVAPSPLAIVVVRVPEGQTAVLIHTDEHGANAMGPGLYSIHGKRELREEITRVSD